jgi:hypothetical protein
MQLEQRSGTSESIMSIMSLTYVLLHRTERPVNREGPKISRIES